MSRYGGGRRHPGIDRLEEQIGEARRAVIQQPVYAALDSGHAIRTFRLRDGILAAVGDRAAA